MKVGIFSDIHGNIYSFREVFRRLLEEKLDSHIFCGDICGYYYSQNEVVEMLSSMENLTCIAGNHDSIFLKCLQDAQLLDDYSMKYGKSIQILARNLSEDTLQFLKSLPESYVDKKNSIATFHGSPWDKLNGYIYPTNSMRRFGDLPYKYIILGHTHYSMIKKVDDVYIINPGSCGQPRDSSRPSYAILDLTTGNVDIKRIDYDIDALIYDIESHNEKNRYLSDVLGRKTE